MSESIEYQLLDHNLISRWDDYVLSNNGSVYHLLQWREVIESVFGHKTYYCTATSNQQIVGVLPLVNLNSLIFGNYLVSMPYFNYGGIIADSAEVISGLLNFSEQLRKQLGCKHCELRMDTTLIDEHSQFFNGFRTDKVTMLLDLPKQSDELWNAIGAKRRAQIKRPIREGASFMIGGQDLLDDFYKVFALNMRDLGTPVYNKKFFKSIMEAFPSKTQIGLVYLDENAVGAGFLLTHNQTMEIPWASTNRQFNKFGINMYLYWNILKSAIEQGIKTFDFGRSSKDAGTLKFKKQWGAEQKQLYWYYQMEESQPIPQLNHNNPKLKLLIDTWKKLPLFITNRIGPHIVKNLP